MDQRFKTTAAASVCLLCANAGMYYTLSSPLPDVLKGMLAFMLLGITGLGCFILAGAGKP